MWKKKQKQKVKVTSQKPFMLRTEQRGKMKDEKLMKKVKDILTEEEKMRIPIAQALPWTIYEPECLIKPPAKESTKPIDVKLRSDMRAIDRAEFDHQLAEEEEIRRLRKELIPKAQPMPYFDKPFIPRRSMKQLTIPEEPKFHIPNHKKLIKCLSFKEMRSYSFADENVDDSSGHLLMWREIFNLYRDEQN
ncbi:unnamed protein product [Trifolium pratense]|uniref:Uncharacterized protein n=1 Tax=Trifolium pratense TaxID=57577 RepID=A0ACB0LAD3_TRIPR|nr:unnamed protein product [Trifolium pratense]